MSLDFTLYVDVDTGSKNNITHVVFEKNVTHNLVDMAKECGIYDCLWRPEENGFDNAGQITFPLKKGLYKLINNPDKYKLLQPSSGYGTYTGLVNFATEVLENCIEHPKCKIEASR